MSLINDWRTVRARLAMLAEGSTTSYNKAGAPGKPGHRILADVTTNTRSIVDVFQARWDRAADDGERRACIDAANAHIDREKGIGRPVVVDREETVEQINRDILKLALGMTPQEVSARKEFLHPSVSRVKELRREHGLDPETGGEDVRARKVRELAGQGVSQREIARRTGVSQPTVHRVLRRAA